MDLRQAKHWSMKVKPDVLLLPSKLNALVRDVNGTLVLNPGQLVKGKSGGTFADLSVHPIDEGALRDASIQGKASMPHAVSARSSVTIAKI